MKKLLASAFLCLASCVSLYPGRQELVKYFKNGFDGCASDIRELVKPLIQPLSHEAERLYASETSRCENYFFCAAPLYVLALALDSYWYKTGTKPSREKRNAVIETLQTGCVLCSGVECFICLSCTCPGNTCLNLGCAYATACGMGVHSEVMKKYGLKCLDGEPHPKKQ